jgi:CheY-like chemotaxis protein
MKTLDCILLIEDDHLTNIYNRKIIESTAVTRHVHIVENGLEGLDYLDGKGKYAGAANPAPDLILLDLNMPRMNGWEFIEEYIRMNGQVKKSAKIFFLTSSPNPDDVRRAKEIAEVTGFEKKPLTKERIIGLVKEHFGE